MKAIRPTNLRFGTEFVVHPCKQASDFRTTNYNA